ncbi:TPA: hypothetical protein N0F65_000082 [Lagenidium giganteum]|uniref:Uncharacterized protein n=1 Tax=Lagenidium giganteum TaxID=4803 RepID=A0AAV2YHK6_9STRA|nr:TPA: hypothetical protein N0F65_000082 [Lagenidium giganteum]
MPTPLDNDVLTLCVQFIATTESRNKVYRFLQYSAKMLKWVLMHAGSVTKSELADKLEAVQASARKHGVSRKRLLWVIASLGRVELLFGDARKVYRFFQFMEMLDLLRSVQDPRRIVRYLRRLRVLCFFFFYLLENYVVFLVRIEGFRSSHARVLLFKRLCNGFWCLSILLAFPLDHLLQRGSVLSTIKKLLDLPVAYFALANHRVGDGIFASLGLASAQIGLYLRWLEIIDKARRQRQQKLREQKDDAHQPDKPAKAALRRTWSHSSLAAGDVPRIVYS